MGSQRDQYVNNLKERLDEWNRDIDGLEVRARELASTAREQYEEQMRNLRSRRGDLEARLDSMSGAAEDAWEDLKGGAEAAAETLGSAIRAARARFGSPAGTSS